MHSVREILSYGLIKSLPALVALGMNVVYFNNLESNQYVQYLLIIAIHITFLQMTGGWLSAAQSYVYAGGKLGGSSQSTMQSAGMQLNAALWAIELVLIIFITSSFAVAVVAVSFTLLQTQLQTKNIIFQLNGNVKSQLQLMIIYCVAISVGAITLTSTRSITVLSLLGLHLFGTALALAWHYTAARTPIGRPRYIPLVQLRKAIRYAVPMVLWIFLFATNSFMDRYMLKYIYPSFNPKDYLLSKELTQGVLSLITAPFIMVAHAKVFSCFQKKDIIAASEAISKYASTTFGFCIVILPIADIAFSEFLSRYLDSGYRHSHVVFIFNYLAIALLCMSMYTQKGLEVKGRNALMVRVIFCALTLQLTCHYIFIDVIFIEKLAVINFIASVFYVFVTGWLANDILAVKMIAPRRLTGLLLSLLAYVCLWSILEFNLLQIYSWLWIAWVVVFLLSAIAYMKKIYQIWL